MKLIIAGSRTLLIQTSFLQEIMYHHFNLFPKEIVSGGCRTGADFKHKYTKHFKPKKLRKEIYNLNNIRNRDTYNIAKWTHRLYTCFFSTRRFSK